MSTLFCTTGKLNFSAQVFGKFGKVVTSLLSGFLLVCDVVHPLHNLVGPIMHIISMKFQSFYPLLYFGKIKIFLHRFAANLARCLHACRVVFCLLWCCAPSAQSCRANNAHNFNEISKCLPSFVLWQNLTFLHRFAANLARCLHVCRVVFWLVVMLCILCTNL